MRTVRLRRRRGRDLPERSPAELSRLRDRTVRSGVNPLIYHAVVGAVKLFCLVYLRLERTGARYVPAEGPTIIAANHRSFLDPFVIASMTRRPVYCVAKKELFQRRWQAWFLNRVGAFPVDRGSGDQDAMAAAKAILARGDCVAIFPEGTRVRTGPLGKARRGMGRLALETGACVVPMAVSGTENVRRGWRIRPRKVRIRAGAPLLFPTVHSPEWAFSNGVTERVWACVTLQWEWLGGAEAPPAGDERARRHGLAAGTVHAAEPVAATTAAHLVPRPRTSAR